VRTSLRLRAPTRSENDGVEWEICLEDRPLSPSVVVQRSHALGALFVESRCGPATAGPVSHDQPGATRPEDIDGGKVSACRVAGPQLLDGTAASRRGAVEDGRDPLRVALGEKEHALDHLVGLGQPTA
jgi:hypothetical protein